MSEPKSFTEQRFFQYLRSLDGSGLCFTVSWNDVVEAAWTEQSSRLFGRVGEKEVDEFLRKVCEIHDLTVSRSTEKGTFTLCERRGNRNSERA